MKTELKLNETKENLKILLTEDFANFGNESDINFLKDLKKDFNKFYEEKIKQIEESEKNSQGSNKKNKNFKQKVWDSKPGNYDDKAKAILQGDYYSTFYKDDKHDNMDVDIFMDKEILESYHSFFNKLNEEELCKVKVPYEKTIYRFFSEQEKIISIFNSVVEIIEKVLKNRFRLNKTTRIILYKLKIFIN